MACYRCIYLFYAKHKLVPVSFRGSVPKISNPPLFSLHENLKKTGGFVQCTMSNKQGTMSERCKVKG